MHQKSRAILRWVSPMQGGREAFRTKRLPIAAALARCALPACLAGQPESLRNRKFGGAGRNRTADKSFADSCLTTWRPRLRTKRPEPNEPNRNCDSAACKTAPNKKPTCRLLGRWASTARTVVAIAILVDQAACVRHTHPALQQQACVAE